MGSRANVTCKLYPISNLTTCRKQISLTQLNEIDKNQIEYYTSLQMD